MGRWVQLDVVLEETGTIGCEVWAVDWMVTAVNLAPTLVIQSGQASYEYVNSSLTSHVVTLCNKLPTSPL